MLLQQKAYSGFNRFLWIGLTFLPLFFFAIYSLSGFRGLYGQDSYAYLLYCKALKVFLSGGTYAGTWYWPPAYPMLAALLSFTGLTEQTALLLLNVILFCILIITCLAILKSQHPGELRHISLYLMLFLCLSPFFLRSSLSIMSECSSTAWLCLTFYFACFSRHPFHIAYMALFAVLAYSTRYTSALLALPICFYAFVKNFRKDSTLKWLSALLLACLMLYLIFYVKRDASNGLLQNPWLGSWSPLNLFSKDFVNEDGRQTFMLPNLIQVFAPVYHLGFLFCGVVLLCFVKRSDFKKQNAFLTITVLFYLLFMAGFPTQNHRFLLPVFPFVAVLLYPAFKRLSSKTIVQKFYRLFILLAILIQMGLFLRAFTPMVKREKMEKNIVFSLQSLSPEKPIYSSGLDGAMEVYGLKNSRKNIYLEEFNVFEQGAYVLINPKELEQQWIGTRPYRNWKRMQVQHNMIEQRSLDGAWVLYELR